MKPIIKENVRLDLGEDGAFGSPIHEESLVDGQTPFPERFDGSDAHVPAAARCHQVGADGGLSLAKLLTHLPKVHGKSLQGTLEGQQDSWECVGNKETPALPVQATFPPSGFLRALQSAQCLWAPGLGNVGTGGVHCGPWEEGKPCGAHPNPKVTSKVHPRKQCLWL